MNIHKPSQELSIEESLNQIVEVYTSNFVTFFVPMLIVVLISGVVSAILSSYLVVIGVPIVGSGTEAWNQFFGKITPLLVIAPIFALVSLVIGAVGSGTCIKCASDFVTKGSTNLREAFDFTLHRLLPLMATTILIGLIVALGAFVLVVPGLIFAAMFSLAIPVVLIENSGVSKSMSRSRTLVSNRWLKTFAFYLIIMMIVLFVSLALNLITAPFGGFGWLLSSIISAFIEPILPISSVVYYYSMLAREEQHKVPAPPF